MLLKKAEAISTDKFFKKSKITREICEDLNKERHISSFHNMEDVVLSVIVEKQFFLRP